MMTPEEAQAELRKKLRRSGLLLREPEVLKAMEHSALDEPCYLPLSVKKGELTGALATAEQLGKLGRYIEKLLHDIAREVGQGNVDADPRQENREDTACRYCPYVSACYYEEGRDKPRYLKKTTEKEFWTLLEKEVPHV